MLRYLRRVAELPIEGRDEGAVRALVEAAVPALADEAVLYVMANDGRLHQAAFARRPEMAPGEGTPASPIGRDAPNAAMVAARMGALAYLEDGASTPVVHTGAGPAADATAPLRICVVATPIVREREAVGALQLRVAVDRHYAAGDMDALMTIGSALSLSLENSRLRRDARDARRAKADFLSVMSHELRAPLTAVVGYADLLGAGIPGPVNDNQMSHLGRIKDSAWELLEMIDGILGYARYEGQDTELRIDLVRPQDLVNDVVAVFRSSFREKGLELTLSLGDDLPQLRTDREKAARILLHLLSNAHKFTESGEVRMTVRHDADRIEFTVQDTGAGIPPRDMDHIFEPSWQGQKEDTRTAGGTGMGLSLAKRLTELLGGELAVESRPGVGTTARLLLPREGPHPSFP